MGLFDGPSKDSADKKFQDALNAINAVKAPTVDEQKVQLEQLVQQGRLTPEEVQTYLQQDSGMNDISVDPRFRQAQVGALQQLQDVASQGGLTAIDRAKLGDITDTENAEERGQREAIEQNARERGVGGSDFELASKQISNQEAANRAAKSGMDVAALAEQRALDAMQAAGSMGGQIDQQEFDQQAKVKAAQDAINQFNAANKQQVAGVNTATRNNAQQLNLGEKQRISDVNTTNDNTNAVRNADLIQQKFQDEMTKANAVAGVNTNWGTANQKNANDKYAAQMGAVGTALGAAGTIGAGMVGGPPAAAAASTALKSGAVPALGQPPAMSPTPAGANPLNLDKNNYMLPSDVTAKEDIAPADADLDSFMISLQPYKYKYKDKMKHGEGEQHGVMAQDLAKTPTGMAIVAPTEDGTLGIDTKKGFGVLAAAIGRLNKKVEEKA